MTTTIPPIEAVADQAQVFASAWSIVGGKFDRGNEMNIADDARRILLDMIGKLYTRIAELEAQRTNQKDSDPCIRYGERYEAPCEER